MPVMTRVLVTGGLGFIGSSFVRQFAGHYGSLTIVDIKTYAGDERRLHSVDGRYTLREVDIADEAIADAIQDADPEVVVHFAAESHVTRSETAAEQFFRTNVGGTRRLLEAAEACRVGRFIHVSTDEVYGPCYGRPFKEDAKEPAEGKATSAYARSKALADDLARSFADRLPVIVARPTNCFGPWQHPEKAIPRWIIRAITGRRMPVWGDGKQVRDWMYVEDCCDGIQTLIQRGVPGEVYNVAPEGAQRANLEIALGLASAAGVSERSVYLTEYDRPAHDRRYAVDASKIRALGWEPQAGLEARLAETVQWYRTHRDWWEPLVAEAEALYADAAERQHA